MNDVYSDSMCHHATEVMNDVYSDSMCHHATEVMNDVYSDSMCHHATEVMNEYTASIWQIIIFSGPKIHIYITQYIVRSI